MPKEAIRRRNPLVTWPVVYAIWTSLARLKASPQWPAVLARAAPMTPAQGADEDGARAPVNRPLGRGGGQLHMLEEEWEEEEWEEEEEYDGDVVDDCELWDCSDWWVEE